MSLALSGINNIFVFQMLQVNLVFFFKYNVFNLVHFFAYFQQVKCFGNRRRRVEVSEVLLDVLGG